MKSNLLDYAARQVTNREIFLLNYNRDFQIFDVMISGIQTVWERLSKERDKAGGSYVGLLLFAQILIRQAIIGFQHIASYQSFLAWLTFRPGLEALLIIGKLVDNPREHGRIWKERLQNRKAYDRAFSGAALVSRSLPRSEDLRQVLSRLNDNFMHPNPDFAYRDAELSFRGDIVHFEFHYFDRNSKIHHAHLLAYLNLMDIILQVTQELVNNSCGPSSSKSPLKQPFAQYAMERATSLANSDPLANKIMQELGLWRF